MIERKGGDRQPAIILPCFLEFCPLCTLQTFGKQDPFVRLWTSCSESEKEHQNTRPCSDAVSEATWEQGFRFEVTRPPANEQLFVEVGIVRVLPI